MTYQILNKVARTRMLKKISCLFFILIASQYLYAQDKNSLIHALLLDIQSSQVKQDGEFYAGEFPTFRECGGAPHNYVPDNTIFLYCNHSFLLTKYVAAFKCC